MPLFNVLKKPVLKQAVTKDFHSRIEIFESCQKIVNIQSQRNHFNSALIITLCRLYIVIYVLHFCFELHALRIMLMRAYESCFF